MQDKDRLSVVNDAIEINSFSHYIYQATVTIYQQSPHWLQEKHRNYPWETSHFQTQFITNLAKNFDRTTNRNELINRLITLLKKLFISNFFFSNDYIELINTISQSINFNHSSQLNSHFALLLLDAENLTLTLEMENYLTTICSYPLTVKLAFANWRSLGDKDLEFHNRNYELIHVPAGKNNADRKMLSFGLSINFHYPFTKEVFVCSSDKDLNSLCVQLLGKNLTVYRVSRRAEEIIVINQKTGVAQHYCPLAQIILSSSEEFIHRFKELIKEEQSKTQFSWVKLSRISNLFYKKYNLKLSQAIAQHFPDKKLKDIFQDLKTDFVTHQLSDDSELYLTIFDVQSELAKANNSIEQATLAAETSNPIWQSQEELEAAIHQIVLALKNNLQQEYISLNELATHFHSTYKLPITKAVKDLKIGKKLVNFLLSHQNLKIQKDKQTYKITLK